MRKMKNSGVEWIGEVPNDWEQRPLKSQINCLDGKRIPISSDKRESGPYPYWGAGNITDYVNNYIFDEELVLLGEDGAPFFDKKRDVAFYINEKVWINNHIHVLKPIKSMSAKYLTHYLNIVDYGSYINGSILNKLTQKNMNAINIIYPRFEEQQKIANYLDKKVALIDNIIDKTKESIEEYKKYKQSLITETVTKGLNPDVKMKDSGIEWIGDIPEKWKIVKMVYVTTSYSGGTPSRNEKKYWENGTINWMSSGEVNNEYIYETNEKITISGLQNSSAKYFPIHTVVVALNGQGKTKGMSAVLEIETTVNQSLVGFVCNKEYLNYEYLNLCFKSSYKYNRSYIAGGNKRDGISAGDLKMQKIPLPTLREQEIIANRVKKINQSISELVFKKVELLFELEQYKKSLIYEVVTGKKEIN